jgi:hypothetical protein
LLSGTQAAPATQVTQSPLLQIFPAPQSVPCDALPISVHTGLPVEQEILASRQGLLGTVQDAPSLHATHAPEEQTLPAPQGVPSDWFVPVSVHWAVASPSHVTTPT